MRKKKVFSVLFKTEIIFFMARMLSIVCGVTAKHKFLQASLVWQLWKEGKKETGILSK